MADAAATGRDAAGRDAGPAPREPDALGAGAPAPARGDPLRPPARGHRALRGRARPPARRQPRADPRVDRAARLRGARARAPAPRRDRPLALARRVRRGLPGARGARGHGRAARRAAARATPTSPSCSASTTSSSRSSEGGDVGGFFETNAAFHAVFVDGLRQRHARRDLPPAARPDGPLPPAVAVPARQPRALDRRAPRDRAGRRARATPSAPRASWPSTSRCRRCACSRSTRPSRHDPRRPEEMR